MSKDFWVDIEIVRTSGKIDELITTLNNIKKVYPNIVIEFDCNSEHYSEITEIRIRGNLNGDRVGLITYNEYNKEGK